MLVILRLHLSPGFFSLCRHCELRPEVDAARSLQPVHQVPERRLSATAPHQGTLTTGHTLKLTCRVFLLSVRDLLRLGACVTFCLCRSSGCFISRKAETLLSFPSQRCSITRNVIIPPRQCKNQITKSNNELNLRGHCVIFSFSSSLKHVREI